MIYPIRAGGRAAPLSVARRRAAVRQLIHARAYSRWIVAESTTLDSSVAPQAALYSCSVLIHKSLLPPETMSSKDLLKLIEDSAAAVDVPSTPLQTEIDNPGDSFAHQKAHEASTKVQEVVALLVRAAEHVKATGDFCFDKAKDALGDCHDDRALAALAGVAVGYTLHALVAYRGSKRIA